MKVFRICVATAVVAVALTGLFAVPSLSSAMAAPPDHDGPFTVYARKVTYYSGGILSHLQRETAMSYRALCLKDKNVIKTSILISSYYDEIEKQVYYNISYEMFEGDIIQENANTTRDARNALANYKAAGYHCYAKCRKCGNVLLP